MQTLNELHDAPAPETIPLTPMVYDFSVGGFVPEHPDTEDV
jgi:hypothetical protein